MEAKTKKNVFITFFLTFSLVCAAMVLFGVWYHTEPTFDNEKGMNWNKQDFPLRVCIKQYEGETDTDSVRKTVEVINKRLNFHALAYLGDVDNRCVINGVLGVPQEPGFAEPGGHADWRLFKSCDFRVVNAPPGTESELIQHELGHCLGLAHDPYTSSIMFESVMSFDPTSLEMPKISFREISDDDREALRNRYLNL